ncbi:MAG: CBS domain-containing protein [Acidimicrobiia bacterium]
MTSPADSPFHDVGSIFPGDVELCSVAPSTTVTEALRLMAPNRYSQVPVIENGRVRGVFSLWSLAHHLLGSPNLAPNDLAVEDVMERLPVVTVEDPLDLVLEHLNRHDAVLVESPHGIQAIATGTDVLNYFYRIARPFVLLQEIELALRGLIEACVSEAELAQCIDRALRKKYEGRGDPPERLREMTFEDYRSIVSAKDNWHFFDGVLGRNRELVASKLEQIRRIRNDVFHFRDPVSVIDHETLAGTRYWLFDKATALRARRREGEAR